MEDEDGQELYPILFKGRTDKVFSITGKEKQALDFFIQTKNIRDSAKKAGMLEKHLKEFLKSPRMKAYIESRVTEIARRNDVTLDSVLDRLHQVAFGKLEVTKAEMDALKVLSHFVGIIKPMQTNVKVGVHVETNPLKEKSDKDLDGMILSRVTATKEVTDETTATH